MCLHAYRESCSSPMLPTALHSQFTRCRDDVMMPCGNVPLSPPPRFGGSSAVLCSCSGGTEAGGDTAVGTGLWGCCGQGLSQNRTHSTLVWFSLAQGLYMYL